jgi:hypothetical protein
MKCSVETITNSETQRPRIFAGVVQVRVIRLALVREGPWPSNPRRATGYCFTLLAFQVPPEPYSK